MVPSANVIGLLVNPRFGRDAVEQHRQAVATAVKLLDANWLYRKASTDAEIETSFAKLSEGGLQGWSCRTIRSGLPSKPDIDALIESSTARHLPHSRISGRWRANELRRQSL